MQSTELLANHTQHSMCVGPVYRMLRKKPVKPIRAGLCFWRTMLDSSTTRLSWRSLSMLYTKPVELLEPRKLSENSMECLEVVNITFSKYIS